jgi:hypothetical protein
VAFVVEGRRRVERPLNLVRDVQEMLDSAIEDVRDSGLEALKSRTVSSPSDQGKYVEFGISDQSFAQVDPDVA